MAAVGDIPVAGVSGLYHTFDYSGKDLAVSGYHGGKMSSFNDKLVRWGVGL